MQRNAEGRSSRVELIGTVTLTKALTLSVFLPEVQTVLLYLLEKDEIIPIKCSDCQEERCCICASCCCYKW